MFQKGFYNTDRVSNQPIHETYQHIVVGVAPGGVVVVFLTGNYHRIEIARYQAVETIVSPDEFYDNPDRDNQQQFFDWWFEHSVPQETLSKIKKDGIPFGLWDTYRKRYNWRFDVQFYKEDDKIADMLHFYYINGEEEIIEKIGDEQKIRNKALPKIINIYLPNNWCEATFDEAEIVDAFKKVTQDNPQAEVIIVAKVQFMYKGIDFTVKCGTNELVLKKVKQDMWGYN